MEARFFIRETECSVARSITGNLPFAVGREIERALIETVNAHSNITVFEHHLTTDLVVDEVMGVAHCFGADVLDQQANSMSRFLAPVTMLATGGAGQARPHLAAVCTELSSQGNPKP